MSKPLPVADFKILEDFYVQRTNNHISKVRRWITRFSTTFNLESLLDRLNHDASKFSIPEYEPYIYLTWQYRCRALGIEYTVPEHIEPLIKTAIAHHYASNSHHPEHHVLITKMSTLDLMEMCSDLCGMSDEFSGSPLIYFNRHIKPKYDFSHYQLNIIHECFNTYDTWSSPDEDW